jgi:hypothetical protein
MTAKTPDKASPKAATKTTKKPKSVPAKSPPAKPTGLKKKMSALDAAAQVLAENGGSMGTKELIEVMAARKLWESPNGKTPAATLYAAILRELTTKGAASRFRKTEPGQFAATAVTGKEDEDERPMKAAKSKTTKRGKKKKAPEPAPAEPVATIPDGTPGPESVSELFRI